MTTSLDTRSGAAVNAPVTRFDHITIAAMSFDTAVASYTTLLGIHPCWRGDHPELGTQSALFGLRNAMVEITAPRLGAEEAEGMRAYLDAHGPGLQALALGTDDAARCSKTLRERGVRATPPQPGQAQANGATREYKTVELSTRVTRGLAVLIVERDDFAALTNVTATPDDGANALDHVVIRTGDIEAAKALYGDGMGIRLALEREINGTRMLFFRVGGVTLEVIEDACTGSSDVFYGAAYRVQDLAATHARLSQRGVDVSEIRKGHKPGTSVFSVRDHNEGVATLFLRDPARD